MGCVKETLEEQIKSVSELFIEKTKDSAISLISHFDTDGISSAVIMAKSLKRLKREFSLKIVKSLEKEFIEKLPKEKITVFLDLASNSLSHIRNAGLKKVFIIDHHKTTQQIPEGIEIINPELYGRQKISSSSLAYLFCKCIDQRNSDLAKLAILGMVGDNLDKEMDRLNNHILEDSEIKIKKGLLIYPSTRPLNKSLEYSSNPFIPGVTGNAEGVFELLKEVGIFPKNGKYKSIIDLDEKETQNLLTSIMLRTSKNNQREIIGNIFLIKMFNKLEDVREISAIVNACSRMGSSHVAMQLLMELPSAKKRAEALHAKYRRLIIEALKFANENKNQEEAGVVIVNGKDRIPDTIAGTIASILSNSHGYTEGTVIVVMSYYENKIKISARIVGRRGINLRELLAKIILEIGGEIGGHENAAGAIIQRDKETKFINALKKSFEIQLVKI